MAHKDMTARYENSRERLKNYRADGEVSKDDVDAILEWCDAFDKDVGHVPIPSARDLYERPREHGKVKPRKANTLSAWINHVKPVAQTIDLTDATADDINEATTALLKGDADAGKDGGYAASTIGTMESTLRIFYRYHSDLGVDPRDIYVHDADDGNGGSAWDERDMLTKEEEHAMSQHAGHPRDKAVFHTLLYTGMRNTALRTLRLKDIDIESGRYWFNHQEEGLKNIHRPDESRPLLLATAAIREWLDYHPSWEGPETYEPDHYLITAHPRYSTPDPTEPVSDETIRKAMASITERTEEAGHSIDKPTNPHFMRHNYVTRCKLDCDTLDNDTIKHLIGHAPESMVMETTYAHISGESHAEKAEEAYGIRDPSTDDGSSFVPDSCKFCQRVPRPGAKRCDNCGNLFSPDAFVAEQGIEDAIFESKGRAETPEQEQGVNAIRDVIQNDRQAKEVAMDELKAEMKEEIVADIKADFKG